MDMTLTMISRVIVAAILGAVLGVERSRAGQAAGVRTNLMISVAACLFTFLGAEVFSSEPGMGPRDPARVAAQIVTGVGFLGAGTLLQTKNKIRGLTTAATIWLVAAVGMAVGVGFYSGAVFVTIFAVIALIMLAPVSEYLSHEASEERKIKARAAKKQEKKLKEWWTGRQPDNNGDEDDHITVED